MDHYPTLLLSGCGSSDALPDLESQRLDLSVKASDKVNPDNQKKAAPIEIRVYELKNDAAFTTADYWSLHDNDKSVLTDDLVRRDSFILRPGEEKKLRRPLNAQTTAIGVLAGYRNLAKSVWRVTYKIPEAPEKAWYSSFIPGKGKVQLEAELEQSAIVITERDK
ncbi:type VI secretion system lipoprotein TssJ [Salmonella enterica subsp. enterica serovar Chailey]|nr:type VI secretion system lipoprotein TssJ [Salmonella enterica]EBE8988423.1 type VI secretion system lipoprotein TssJ [Salmonella enterica subsp. enterica serovar Chailey]EDB5290646.1 type VI secretion system lipoprotein TssJ [Salmonella enterica subsp. enterica serovar Corvallis]EAN8525980.1 type VI secretion system lipoprotein TssJ [Salmonella enterica]EBG4895551.1 type VI secretion system lipoprotein TssJ [Salmonella enterica subsp. enterica serovar Chailey]